MIREESNFKLDEFDKAVRKVGRMYVRETSTTPGFMASEEIPSSERLVLLQY